MPEIYIFVRIIPMYRPGYYGPCYLYGFALDEDGEVLAKVVEQSEQSAIVSLGGDVHSPESSQVPYETKYPNGYKLVYVPRPEQGSNPSFLLALEKYKENCSGGGGLDPNARYLVTENGSPLILED